MTLYRLLGGIDGAGVMDESRDACFFEGDSVLASGWGLYCDHDERGGELLPQINPTLVSNGNIAAVVLAVGHDLHTTVIPVVLRGLSLPR